MPITLNQVERYLENKNVAVVGASRDAKAFSNVIIKELKAKGYVVYPVNPNADTIQEMKAYKSIKEVPKQANAVYIITKSTETDAAIDAAIAAGYKNIWVHSGSETKNVSSKIKEGVNLIYGQCLIMYINNTGVHRFHRFVMKLLNKIPK